MISHMGIDKNTHLRQQELWTSQLGILVDISDTALEISKRLSEKRVTLEEKMITLQLHRISALCIRIARDAPLRLTQASAEGEVAGLDQLRSLCQEMKDQLQELLKIINYDLNFLEQYFEFDFNARLQYEHRFVERLTEMAKSLGLDDSGPVD